MTKKPAPYKIKLSRLKMFRQDETSILNHLEHFYYCLFHLGTIDIVSNVRLRKINIKISFHDFICNIYNIYCDNMYESNIKSLMMTHWTKLGTSSTSEFNLPTDLG